MALGVPGLVMGHVLCRVEEASNPDPDFVRIPNPLMEERTVPEVPVS